MFAIISYKGNQYKVSEGQQYRVDLIKEETDNKKITFSDVLMISDDKNSTVGTPNVAGASVEAEIVGTDRDKKVNIFKFRAKKRYKKTAGHKQDKTLIKVLKISVSKKAESKPSLTKKNEK